MFLPPLPTLHFTSPSQLSLFSPPPPPPPSPAQHTTSLGSNAADRSGASPCLLLNLDTTRHITGAATHPSPFFSSTRRRSQPVPLRGRQQRLCLNPLATISTMGGFYMQYLESKLINYVSMPIYCGPMSPYTSHPDDVYKWGRFSSGKKASRQTQPVQLFSPRASDQRDRRSCRIPVPASIAEGSSVLPCLIGARGVDLLYMPRRRWWLLGFHAASLPIMMCFMQAIRPV